MGVGCAAKAGKHDVTGISCYDRLSIDAAGGNINALVARMESLVNSAIISGDRPHKLARSINRLAAAGVSGALIFSYLASLIFKPKMKS